MPIAKIVLASLAAAVAASAQSGAAAQSRAVAQKVCSACHTLESVTATRRSRAEWQETIDKMITLQGAKGTPAEFATVLDYLLRC